MAMAFGDGEDGVDDLKFWAFCFWLLALGFLVSSPKKR